MERPFLRRFAVFLYLFGVWAMLILLAFGLSLKLASADDRRGGRAKDEGR